MTEHRMPAEWERHEATWLSWPNDVETWPNELKEMERTYLSIIRNLHTGEKVHVLVPNPEFEKHVAQLLKTNGIQKNVFLHQIPTDSVWIRDYGPIFVKSEANTLITHWRFNAWGGKYEKYGADSQVPQKIETYLQMKRIEAGIILEGGSIDVNGSGLCMTTEQCLLNPNRNPALSRKDIEAYLSKFLGIREVIWLPSGITGDDTDGHIDDFARFVSLNTVVIAAETLQDDPNYKTLRENRYKLQEATINGKRLNLVELPMPEKIELSGVRCPATYSNFYIGNEVVLVPIYGQRKDDYAMKILSELFPDRKVVGINAIPLIKGLGAFHCITQQQPA